MLKSTYKSIPLPELPSGWTEHKAPSGHTYYYNAVTKQSTYTRPSNTPHGQALFSLIGPNESFLQQQTDLTNVLDPKSRSRDPIYDTRNDYEANERNLSNKLRPPKPQPIDKPKSSQTIPGHENWKLVHTKYNRRFVYNIEKDQSYWRVPDKLKSGILTLDQTRIKEKAKALNQSSNGQEAQYSAQRLNESSSVCASGNHKAYESSENEEVEITDDEIGEDSTVDPLAQNEQNSEMPIEFTENDFDFQLAAISEEYGLEPDEYEVIDRENQGKDLDQDSVTIFKDMLDKFNMNPYSPWEKIVDEGKLIDDIRYTALPNMKTRKKVWDEWSGDKIKSIRESRAKKEKKNPQLQYMEFLQKYATPKLYWLEFKRKYRKETEMRDPELTDKDREKMYRDHISRLKLSHAK
ncbi:Pre-mRNA-splicing factor dre4 [Erysiphe neolycopersici]|uniref:Pre-mRNA-splicing factor dre4 n=1 Tax=Erysiphe neolycopersici TaxID=212602 RepID=A0A420HGT4_9PEZI|nr:Pre-mRNA-splicing factor dre4 [Erysiphe neolycopersici]